MSKTLTFKVSFDCQATLAYLQEQEDALNRAGRTPTEAELRTIQAEAVRRVVIAVEPELAA